LEERDKGGDRGIRLDQSPGELRDGEFKGRSRTDERNPGKEKGKPGVASAPGEEAVSTRASRNASRGPRRGMKVLDGIEKKARKDLTQSDAGIRASM